MMVSKKKNKENRSFAGPVPLCSLLMIDVSVDTTDESTGYAVTPSGVAEE